MLVCMCVCVLVRPQVQVIMDPTEPVSEEDRVNVTLICDVVKSNPEKLVRVRWYLEGGLLKVGLVTYALESLEEQTPAICSPY